MENKILKRKIKECEKVNKEFKNIASFCNAFWYTNKLKNYVLDKYSEKWYKETLKLIYIINKKIRLWKNGQKI